MFIHTYMYPLTEVKGEVSAFSLDDMLASVANQDSSDDKKYFCI
jgi:hypothetical protein